ncbi:MAG: DUF177 domain-containing protein [Candidatus Microthrix sp.]|nr:DUF177 domain-containing protein [Candidatus Microthrix sp.]MBK6439510.1 DUF177 domain-containing protein [Candidatus Microthrix sp.]
MPLDGELAIEDDRIDLTEAVRAAVVLALPMAPLCSDDCMGPDPEAYPVTVEDEDADGEAPHPTPGGRRLSSSTPTSEPGVWAAEVHGGRRDGNVVGWP